MIYAIAAFGAAFLLTFSVGMLLFYRAQSLVRISEAINPRPTKKSLQLVLKQTGFSLGSVLQKIQMLLPKSNQEVSIVRERLQRAGYREESTVRFFYGCKVVGPVLLCTLCGVTGLAAELGAFFVYASALAVGYLAPDFALGKMIAARQKRIRRGLPDVLDLIVICVEAGLSMDQATARTADELKAAQPDLCDELGIVVLEQRAGRPRAEAWRRMADRTDEPGLRNLVSMLVQAEQFGTSIAKTLRIHSDQLRSQRVQMIEEMAAKMSVKLVFPLVLFIFPSLFLVCIGPAAIVMMESFSSLLGK